MSIQKTLADRVEKERAEKEAEAAAAQVDGEAAVEPVEAMDAQPGVLAPWADWENRKLALERAVEIHGSLGGGDDEDVVATAEAFLAFLAGGAK